MRIWDIHPGYLSQSRLLEECRDLDAVVARLHGNNEHDSQDPEVLRWTDYGWAIKHRQKKLVCEMALRGDENTSVINTQSNTQNFEIWPSVYIDKPDVQIALLKEHYINKETGRIVLPNNGQVLWSQHKYSILARDPNRYKMFGKMVATQSVSFETLALELVDLLRVPPSEGGIRNALQHMWGHVSDVSEQQGCIDKWSLQKLLLCIQENVKKSNEPYLTNSTALSDLMVWL
ncbi:DUF1722 domain-containing protein [Paraglaciecola sp. L3A3]|uniref:DUF1722 domain-containing protein n=1 Tax=Paraglaciecola sp. L3A3 TaxID=2686358 RepID=UPI00131BCF51|nr:DUF1722 domain-containing protein [Paraglaciecola sp. L3A3]